jgi:hypothetical protein
MFRNMKIRMKLTLVCTVVVASAGCSHTAGSTQAAQLPVTRAAGLVAGPQSASAESATPIPGTDPAIQRWFLANGGAKVAFNNALLRAHDGVAAGKPGECQPLGATARVLLNVLPGLKGLSVAGQKLAAAFEIPVATFSIAASQCQAGDFAAAKATLDLGVKQQADAQAAVDEILDGDR